MSNPFNTEKFLNEHWQQSPLLIRKAFDLSDLISSDELAGLAMESEVESRLISGSTEQDDWHIKHGPFDEADFAELPERQWTLLVQAVDHWLPEVRDVLKQFSFLPQWRIDDIMISFATDGGGVGPHFDQYDVFLIQLEGTRNWKTGQLCDDDSDLIDGMPVKVLAQFDEQDSWDLEPGDTLYLPPGVAHWGTSKGNSMTLSVGFRAPAESEFISDFGHFLSAKISDFARYQDQQISNRETSPHQIQNEDIKRLQTILKTYADDEALLKQWFGQYMTEPKYADAGVDTGDWSFDDFKKHVQSEILYRNPASRLAFTNKTLFVDGQTITTELDDKLLHLLCDAEQFDFEAAKHLNSAEFIKLCWTLLNLGAFYFED